MGFARAVWILFSHHLGKTLTSRRALGCAALGAMTVAAATLLAWIITQEEPGPYEVEPVVVLFLLLQIQVIVPLIALVVGSAVVSEEIDDRTITYLFTRPIPRPAILIGRWLASVVLVTLVLGTSTLAALAILDAALVPLRGALDPAIPRRILEVVLLGGAVYSGLFAALGALVRRPVIVGLGYSFAVEVFLANLPGGNQSLTIQYYLRSILFGVDADLGPVVRELELMATELATPPDALRTLAIVLAVALGLGSWAIARRQYVLPA